MPAIIAWPTVVQDALIRYGDLFANEPERRHFAEYLTGLLVAPRKTVSGINAEFAVTTDQSCLNRWLTEVAWDVQALNERRLAELQRDPSTRYAAQGVIALDHTLLAHDGTRIEDVGWYRDHAEQRHLVAHDDLIAHYVCASGKHYPLEFRRFRKASDGRRLPSKTTRRSSASRPTGSSSATSLGTSPSTATSPTRRSSTTSTPSGGATWAT
jgi:hypothetical protein